jgi:beta-phosphoglucomutase family hydrolase
MKPLRNLSAVLWDMDGVLVDTFDTHFHAWRHTFEELSQPFDIDMFRRTFGMNNRLILTTIFERDLGERFIQRVSDRKEELFRDCIKGRARLLTGVKGWLTAFSEMGVKQAVASSAPQANIDALLDELKVRSFFQAEAAGATLKGKPDPAVFLLAAHLLGVEAAHCLVIEDAVSGVEAARRAGMKCIAVQTTNPAEKLKSANVVLKDLSFLTEKHLQKLFG